MAVGILACSFPPVSSVGDHEPVSATRGLATAAGRAAPRHGRSQPRRGRAGRAPGDSRRIQSFIDDDAAMTDAVSVAGDVSDGSVAGRRALTLNRVYAVLSEVGTAMVRASDPGQLLTQVCRILVETGGFSAAAFTTAATHPDGVVVLARGTVPAPPLRSPGHETPSLPPSARPTGPGGPQRPRVLRSVAATRSPPAALTRGARSARWWPRSPVPVQCAFGRRTRRVAGERCGRLRCAG